MDLLSQYKKENPEAFREQKQAPATDEYGRVYTSMIALVMRLSGGRVRDARTASYALLSIAILGALVAVSLYLSSGTTSHPIINAPPPETITSTPFP